MKVCVIIGSFNYIGSLFFSKKIKMETTQKRKAKLLLLLLLLSLLLLFESSITV